MKKELLEYLVRSCVREVLDQVQGAPANARDFHQDSQGMWCKTCGNKGKLVKLPNGETAYSCGNTTCPSYRNLQRQRRLEEGEEADSMDDQDQESKANADHKDRERRKAKKNANGGKDDFARQHQDFKDRYAEVEDPTKGAPAPPEAGQGTADTPEIPKEKEPQAEPSAEPEGPPPSPELKGIKLLNPKDKSKLIDQGKYLKPGNDAALERSLFRTASTLAGPSAKVALSTMRAVKDALKNPSAPLFLYLGKYDPNSDEIFLMADKSLQVAKDSSVSPAELTGTPIPDIPPSSQFDPMAASTPELGQRMVDRGEYGSMTPRRGIDEKLHRAIKKIVNEVINRAE